MNRWVCGFALAAASLGPGAACAAGQDVVFRSDVSLVRVDAQVLDRDNRAITGLHAEDFILTEEGRPQPIRNFGLENMPVDVVLLLDVSRSMRPHVERIASAAHEALRVLGSGDRVAIMVFDRSSRVRLPFRQNRDEVEREFESLLRQETFDGGTDITRALLDAANYVGRNARREARRAIVIVTDDQTERNRDEAAVSRALTKADAVLSALLAPDAMRYGGNRAPGRGDGTWGTGGSWPGGGSNDPLGGIILGRRRGPLGGGGPYGGGRRRGPVIMRPHTQPAGTAEIARQSGGDSMSVDDASAFETTLARIRQRYALHFYLPPDVKPGQERHIQVELAEAARRRYPAAEVRYRRVYLAPETVAASASPGSEAPVVVRASSPPPAAEPQPAEDPAPGRLKRRAGVDPVPDQPRGGPMVTGKPNGQP